MNYIALQSFSGIISMAEGEVREISNKSLAKDLMDAKLIKKYVPSDSTEIQEELDKANKRITELEEENKNLTANIATVEDEKAKLEEEIQTLKASLETPEGEGATPTTEGTNENPEGEGATPPADETKDNPEGTEKTTTKNSKK